MVCSDVKWILKRRLFSLLFAFFALVALVRQPICACGDTKLQEAVRERLCCKNSKIYKFQIINWLSQDISDHKVVANLVFATEPIIRTMAKNSLSEALERLEKIVQKAML